MEPAAIRHKNPGAMWPGSIATKWGSTKWVYLNDGTGQGGNGKGNKIATFDNWEDGICAQLDLWRSSPRYKNQPFGKAIAIWSGGNHVQSYINYVKARIPEMDEHTIMNDAFWKSPTGVKFLKVQAAHEAGKPIPASDDDYIRAQRRVFGGMPLEAQQKPVQEAKAIVATTVASTAVIASTAPGMPSWLFPLLIGGILVGVGICLYQKFKDKHEQVQKRNGALPPEGDVLRGDGGGQVPSPVHSEGP